MENPRMFPRSFGELLKIYRKRQRLTQKHLAQQLGVHMNTISSWELGTYLPATRGLVLELARHLHLDDQEAHHLLEASLTALPPYWHVPFPRNPFFTGREEILETLHTHLHAEHVVALTQSYALHGLGGIGKTQIALEYAYQHALSYRAVF
jgi:transcriptional regulator with XRE-family HTH domain